MTKSQFIRTLAALCILTLASAASAFPNYVTAFKNKYPTTTLDTRLSCTICHTEEDKALEVNCYRKALNLLGNVPIAQRIDMLDAMDSDGDGIPNGVEAVTPRPDGGVGFSPGLVGSTGRDPCGANVNKAVTSVCESPKDTDGDGTIDCFDSCPNDPNKTSPGVCGCDVPDVDTDGDGVLDCVDQCPGVDDKLDANADGVPDCLEGPAIKVDDTSDTVDISPGDGVCADSLGHCTLRAAIMEANAKPDRNIIMVPAGHYTLTISGANADQTMGDLNIETNLSIVGAGAAKTIIDGGGLDRVLDLGSFQRLIFISNLTITGGAYTGFGGGGVFSNDNKLTLTNCIITGNTVASSGPYGGGIFAGGELTLINCSVNGNQIQSSGVDGFGAGVYLTPGAKATLTNCTISNNTGTGTGVKGGGLAIALSVVTIKNCTIFGNDASGGADGIYYDDGGGSFPLSIGNTILAGNPAGNCEFVSGPLISLGHNLEDADTCGFHAAGDLINLNPMLDALHDNGGGLPTQVPQAGSPAVDAGLDSLAPAQDQRGFPRPGDGNKDGTSVSDIGAIERSDCDGNGIDDGREVADGVVFADCNHNGTPDACETANDCDHNGIPDECETDTDGDGKIDACDPCPNGGSEADSDGEGVIDCLDDCPQDPNKTSPGTCGCGVADTDTDGDGTPDCVDNCPNVANPDQDDSDGDGIGDACPEDHNKDDSNPGDNPSDTPDDPGNSGNGSKKCGAGLCGAGAAPLLAITMLCLVWTRRSYRR